MDLISYYFYYYNEDDLCPVFFIPHTVYDYECRFGIAFQLFGTSVYKSLSRVVMGINSSQILCLVRVGSGCLWTFTLRSPTMRKIVNFIHSSSRLSVWIELCNHLSVHMGHPFARRMQFVRYFGCDCGSKFCRIERQQQQRAKTAAAEFPFTTSGNCYRLSRPLSPSPHFVTQYTHGYEIRTYDEVGE